MNVAHTIVTGFAVATTGFSAVSVFMRAKWVVEPLADYGVPRSWWTPLGAAKAAGALGMLAGLFLPVIGVLASVSLVLYFIGAAITVLRARSYSHVVFPLIYLAPVAASLVLGSASLARFGHRRPGSASRARSAVHRLSRTATASASRVRATAAAEGGHRMFISGVAHVGAGMAGVGLAAIGGYVLVAPVSASRGYGVPITGEDAAAKAFAAGAGVRDIAAGAAILLVSATAGSVPLALVVLAATLIPVGDLYVLARHRSPFGPAYLVHGAGAALMLLVAVTLLLV